MKLYRFYYNRANEWPQVWSVDEGSQASEINVVKVRCMVPCISHSVAVPAKERHNRPSAWMEAYGELRLENGVAIIEYVSQGQP